MTIRKSLILLGTLFFLALVLLVTFAARRPLQATITVLDPAGKPISNAVIKPTGLRSKGGASHFGWPATAEIKPDPVETDAEGKAVVRYPPFVMEQVETGTITFEINHPDYAWARAERVVDPSPTATASLLRKAQYAWKRLVKPGAFTNSPVVLTPGGTVVLSGYFEDKEKLLPSIYVDPTFRLDWMSNGPGVLISKRHPAGTNYLRAVHFPEKGRMLFSEVTPFLTAPGATNRLHLELKPGKRLEVKLSTNVPRPIKNGRVALSVDPTNVVDPQDTAWHAWRELDTNGVCVFDSLPPGQVKIIGICEGYTSANGPVIPGRSQSVSRAQRFDLEADKTFELEMSPSAVCEVLVLDPQEKPLPGAHVYFSPNVIGLRGGIFAQSLYNSAELIRTTNRVVTRFHDYEAKTDTNGIAVIRSLPAFGQRNFFSVEHPDYEMPFDTRGSEWRHGRVLLHPGQTSSVTVIMEKRGTSLARDVP